MLLLYLTDGECIEVPEAVRVTREAGMLFCYDRQDNIVRAIDAERVAVYSTDPEIIEVVREEACNDEATPSQDLQEV